jgi:hypothetical protein
VSQDEVRRIVDENFALMKRTLQAQLDDLNGRVNLIARTVDANAKSFNELNSDLGIKDFASELARLKGEAFSSPDAIVMRAAHEALLLIGAELDRLRSTVSEPGYYLDLAVKLSGKP